ncbi:hypothetical protein [Leptospira yasudae]|uniref:DUF2029 domain-containing protein n=1 Tax=Leptospira yasudae TaxID=2202201 RepID=A0A6N4QR87_9LEPT|nr:hypothetical protein [Leptospira yasudae]TGL75342.1 hypothetical protein EHQ72_16295 [Leptospira yasudae]TGL77588.1 hypothetical protein EHQ77_15470 [Leptospira yasudae]TGL79232.1 hypothetical protein EHQ83_18465 [Leptospira yasudae]
MLKFVFSEDRAPFFWGLFSLVLYGVLFYVSAQTPSKIGLILFLGTYWILMGIAFFPFFSKKNEREASVANSWIWGILFRITCIFAVPLWEDDWARFLWDGYQTLQTGTPYGKTPASFFTAEGLPPWTTEILSRINHPDVPTIYGPVLEFVFLAGAFCFPGSLWGLKLIYLAIELPFWVWLSKNIKKNEFTILFWCPLLVIETYVQAHPDFLGLLFVAGSAIRLSQKRSLSSGIFLGLACGVKTFGWILVPFFFLKSNRPRFIAGLIPAFLIPYLFFRVQGGVGGDGLRIFLENWEFNSSLYSLIKWGFGFSDWHPGIAAGVVCLVSWGILGIFHVFSFVKGDASAVSKTFLWFFLFSPVVNVWYLLWPLFFWVRQPILPGIVFCFAVCLATISGRTLAAEELGLQLYENPLVVRSIEYSLVFLAFFVQNTLQKEQNIFQ